MWCRGVLEQPALWLCQMTISNPSVTSLLTAGRLVCTNSPAADLGNGNPAWPLTPTLRSAKALGSLKGPKAFCPRGWFLVKTTKFMDRKGILAGHPCFHSLGLCFKGEVPSSRVEFQATPSKQGL